MRKLARFEIVRDWATMLLKRPTKSPEIGQAEASVLGNLDVVVLLCKGWRKLRRLNFQYS